MADSSRPLQEELARLMNLIADARATGNATLVEVLTERAAHCLMQIAGVPLPDAPQQQQQQQQKVPPKKDK